MLRKKIHQCFDAIDWLTARRLACNMLLIYRYSLPNTWRKEIKGHPARVYYFCCLHQRLTSK